MNASFKVKKNLFTHCIVKWEIISLGEFHNPLVINMYFMFKNTKNVHVHKKINIFEQMNFEITYVSDSELNWKYRIIQTASYFIHIS